MDHEWVDVFPTQKMGGGFSSNRHVMLVCWRVSCHEIFLYKISPTSWVGASRIERVISTGEKCQGGRGGEPYDDHMAQGGLGWGLSYPSVASHCTMDFGLMATWFLQIYVTPKTTENGTWEWGPLGSLEIPAWFHHHFQVPAVNFWGCMWGVIKTLVFWWDVGWLGCG